MNYSDIDKNQVLELHQAGSSIRQISSYTNIPKSTVADWIKECSQSTPKGMSDCCPDEPDTSSGHPQISNVSDDLDILQEDFDENTGQNNNKVPPGFSMSVRSPFPRTDVHPYSDIEQREKLVKQPHIEAPNETQKDDQPDINPCVQEQGDKKHEPSTMKQNTKLKLKEQSYLGRLKSLARYYYRKKSWKNEDLLDLQDRVIILRRKLKNFYTINSHIHWNKNGLKYLLELEDDIEDITYNNEEDDPFELVLSKSIKRILRRIENL